MWTILLLATLFAQAPQGMKPGTERWSVKTSLPTTPGKAQNVAITDLLAIQDVSGVKKDDKRYQSQRMPAAAGAKYNEGAMITTTAYLHLVAFETDGDFHIQVSDSPTSGDNCLIVEVPNPDPAYVSNADLRPTFDAVRTFIKTNLLKGKDPTTSGSVMQHPVYVTVTGVLFYDDSHVGDPPRGKKGMHAATLWELHPLTAIAFAAVPKKGTPTTSSAPPAAEQPRRKAARRK